MGVSHFVFSCSLSATSTEVMKASQQAIERGVKDCLFIDYKRRSGHFDVTTVASIKEITDKVEPFHCLFFLIRFFFYIYLYISDEMKWLLSVFDLLMIRLAATAAAPLLGFYTCEWRRSHVWNVELFLRLFSVIYFVCFFLFLIQGCHCLLDIAPHAIERLHSVHIYPIVVFIRYKNAKQIK